MESANRLYRIQPVRDNMLRDGPTEREQELVGKHFLYLNDLHAQGVVRLAGRTLNTHSTASAWCFSAPRTRRQHWH